MFLSKIKDFIGGGLGELANIADKFITTPDEKKEFQKYLKELKHNMETEVYNLEAQDRVNARDLYKEDSRLQKTYAIVFLSSYIILTGTLLYGFYQISNNKIHVDEYIIGFVSTLFGAMSTKVSTITDFLFGGSVKTKDS
jgi:hypothetical protein